MAGIDSQCPAGFGNPVAVNILTHGCKHFYIHTHEGHIVGDVSAHTSQAHGHFTGIGIRCNQLVVRTAANIHIDTAYHHRIAAGTQYIAFTCDVTLFQQIGNMHRHGRTGDVQIICQLLLGDHGIGRNEI